ncbi:hypothetical protein BDM02DRAFT_966159 [Thelephora ganbajun]|uniref:Uncharacterized protein n=1 Tax=Thelephora ganbajun TaxID=370292 RepID=A0ACB6ZNW6_THEGA|nr:hypothetical protein BDM02DRAFT_966159 [Thelephora ganbajun]
MTNTTGNATLNDLPQELLDAIIDLVPRNVVHLKRFALVGKRWVRRCQERLFERFTLSSQATERWTRPVMQGQPLLFSYVRTLTLWGVYQPDWMNPNFERHMSCLGGGSGSFGLNDGDNDSEPSRVHTLRLMDSSVDLDGEVISRVLGPLRSSVRTVVMGSVSLPPLMEVRPFFCMFSELQDVHVSGPQFSSITPHGESRLAKEFTLPPLNGGLNLLFLYHGVEGVLSSLSKLPLRFRSITVSPPNGQCDLEINNILVTCGETVKTFHVKRMKLDVQILRPIDLSPCTELEEIRVSLRDARDPGPGTIHLFDSVTSPHLSRIVLHFIVPLNSRKIDSSIYPTDWSRVDESLHRLAERLRVMHESRSSALGTTPSWTALRQKKEVKRLKVMVEARFLFVPLSAEKVDLGAFLSKFREVGDVDFVPQKIRTLNEDGPGGWLTLPSSEGLWR